jgi:cyclophilin family peptidyl-prolyl cis-trans isomerase/predicted small secreted protein
MPARRLVPLLLLALALVLAACGGGDSGGGSDDQAKATATATEAPSSGDDTGCTAAQPGKAKVPNPKKPSGRLDASKTYVVQVTTNCGAFEITLATKRAPKTAASFASLVRQGFFDGLTFHRIVPGFVIQGGDPEGNGQGGPGYSVTEAPPENLSYTRGVVAMAKTGAEPPGTSGSQFFVVTAEDAGLPPDYALLGRVTKGQEVVDAIGVVPTQPDEQPTDPVVMQSVKLVER